MDCSVLKARVEEGKRTRLIFPYGTVSVGSGVLSQMKAHCRFEATRKGRQPKSCTSDARPAVDAQPKELSEVVSSVVARVPSPRLRTLTGTLSPKQVPGQQDNFIGSGASKTVYLYEWRNSDSKSESPKDVAAYSIRGSTRASRGSLEHEIFIQQMLNEVDREGFVQSHGVLNDQHVLEFFKDGSLEKYTYPAAGGKPKDIIPTAWIPSLTKKVCGAIGKMHAAGVAHRDIKPDNIFIEIENRTLKRAALGDMGLAYHFSEGANRGRTLDGTGAYFSPEYLKRVGLVLGPEADELDPKMVFGVDQRRDIWATGLTLLNLLGSTLPHQAAANMPATIHMLANLKQGSVDEAIDRAFQQIPEYQNYLHAKQDFEREDRSSLHSNEEAFRSAAQRWEPMREQIDRVKSLVSCALQVEGSCAEFQQLCNGL